MYRPKGRLPKPSPGHVHSIWSGTVIRIARQSPSSTNLITLLKTYSPTVLMAIFTTIFTGLLNKS